MATTCLMTFHAVNITSLEAFYEYKVERSAQSGPKANNWSLKFGLYLFVPFLSPKKWYEQNWSAKSGPRFVMFSNQFQSHLFDEKHFDPKTSILNWSGPSKMQLTDICGPESDLSEKCGSKLQK